MNQEEVFQTLKDIVTTCNNTDCMNCKIHWFCIGWKYDEWEEAHETKRIAGQIKSIILTPPED